MKPYHGIQAVQLPVDLRFFYCFPEWKFTGNRAILISIKVDDMSAAKMLRIRMETDLKAR